MRCVACGNHERKPGRPVRVPLCTRRQNTSHTNRPCPSLTFSAKGCMNAPQPKLTPVLSLTLRAKRYISAPQPKLNRPPIHRSRLTSRNSSIERRNEGTAAVADVMKAVANFAYPVATERGGADKRRTSLHDSPPDQRGHQHDVHVSKIASKPMRKKVWSKDLPINTILQTFFSPSAQGAASSSSLTSMTAWKTCLNG